MSTRHCIQRVTKTPLAILKIIKTVILLQATSSAQLLQAKDPATERRKHIFLTGILSQVVFVSLFVGSSAHEASAQACHCQSNSTYKNNVLAALAKKDDGQLTLALEANGSSSNSIGTATNTTMQGNVSSQTLQTGTESTLIQGGTQGAMVQGQVEKEAGPVNILLLIDASYSMKEGLGGSIQKMDAAKQVLQNTLSRIPTDINLGLRVFGQSFSNDPSSDCQQSALLVPIGQGNRRSIIEQMRQIHPFGLTPLTYALMQAERDLRSVQGPKTLILITDGAETCGGNPCEYVRRLNQIGIKIKVDIVGLGLKRERDARAQLNCIAEASGGKYYDANTAAELIDSVTKSVSKAISGRVIIKGKEGAATPPELVPIETILGK